MYTPTSKPPTSEGWRWMMITNAKHPVWQPVEISLSNGNFLYLKDKDGDHIRFADFLEYRSVLWSLEEIETPKGKP